MLDVNTDVIVKSTNNEWFDLYDRVMADIGEIVPESEFDVTEKCINDNKLKKHELIDNSGLQELYLSMLNKDNPLKNKFNFEEHWINYSKLYNKNTDYTTIKIQFQNSIYNSNENEKLFNEEIKSIKDNFNSEIWNLYTEYHKKFLTKHNEKLINLKHYGFNFNYFSPLMRYLSIFFLIHDLNSENKKYFLLFLNTRYDKVTTTSITSRLRVLDIDFIENFIKCLLMEEGKETKILGDLEKLMDYLELETKNLKFDFENIFDLNKFYKYISPNVNLTTTDINKINDYIFESISDIIFYINSAIKVVSLQNNNHDFNKYLNLYNINKNSIEQANSKKNISQQEKEKENIKKELELIKPNQIARLLINLTYDLVDEIYILNITRSKYCKNILQYFHVKEELISQTINAIGKSKNEADLKDLTKPTYQKIFNYFDKYNVNIKNFSD